MYFLKKKNLTCVLVVLYVLFFRCCCYPQKQEFIVPDEMSKYRLCEIADGGHFFVHDAEGGDLARIEAKLKELKDKVRAGGGLGEGLSCFAWVFDLTYCACYVCAFTQKTFFSHSKINKHR